VTSEYQRGFYTSLMICIDVAKEIKDLKVTIEYLEWIKKRLEGGLIDALIRDIGSFEEFEKRQMKDKVAKEVEAKV